MKNLFIILTVLTVLSAVLVNRLKNGRTTTVVAESVPPTPTLATERAQIIAPTVAGAVVLATKHIQTATYDRVSTLLPVLVLYKQQVSQFYKVFDEQAPMAMAGVTWPDPFSDAEGSLEDFEANAREFEKHAPTRDAANEKIGKARAELEQALGPELTSLFRVWSETNGVPQEVLVRLHTVHRMPDHLAGKYQ